MWDQTSNLINLNSAFLFLKICSLSIDELPINLKTAELVYCYLIEFVIVVDFRKSFKFDSLICHYHKIYSHSKFLYSKRLKSKYISHSFIIHAQGLWIEDLLSKWTLIWIFLLKDSVVNSRKFIFWNCLTVKAHFRHESGHELKSTHNRIVIVQKWPLEWSHKIYRSQMTPKVIMCTK